MKNCTLLFIAVLFISASANRGFTDDSKPVINEIMASNTVTYMDEDREYPDWVEIYNPGDASINLDGYGLSDRPDNPYKWIFPVVTLEPEQYLIVYASGKDRVDSNNYHTNFKIDADGETLVLTDKAGVLCDSVTVKINETDISLGRKPDGNGAWMLFSEPTPGADNAADGFQGYTDAVVEMSMAGGFYNSRNLCGVIDRCGQCGNQIYD